MPPGEDAMAPNSVVLEKLLKQDLDINTEELEDLMDDFDIDDIMNKPIQNPFPIPPHLQNGMMGEMPVVAQASEEYDDDFDSDEEFINGQV